MIILLFTTDAKNWIWWNVAVRLSLVRLQLKKFCWSTHKTSMIFWQPPIKIRMKTVWRSSAQTTMPFIFIRYGINHVEYFKFEEKKNWKNRRKKNEIFFYSYCSHRSSYPNWPLAVRLNWLTIYCRMVCKMVWPLYDRPAIMPWKPNTMDIVSSIMLQLLHSMQSMCMMYVNWSTLTVYSPNSVSNQIFIGLLVSVVGSTYFNRWFRCAPWSRYTEDVL